MPMNLPPYLFHGMTIFKLGLIKFSVCFSLLEKCMLSDSQEQRQQSFGQETYEEDIVVEQTSVQDRYTSRREGTFCY